MKKCNIYLQQKTSLQDIGKNLITWYHRDKHWGHFFLSEACKSQKDRHHSIPLRWVISWSPPHREKKVVTWAMVSKPDDLQFLLWDQEPESDHTKQKCPKDVKLIQKMKSCGYSRNSERKSTLPRETRFL